MSDPLDIINRIENAIYYTEDTNVNDLLRDAVDEIERLRAALDSTDAAKTLWKNKAKQHLSRIEHLEAALHIIAGDLHTSWQGDIARAALEGRT